MKTIKIFDTTLRDGEQTPKVSMNIDDKVKIAKQLEKLGVDIIEAGFAFASEGDFEAVKKVAESVTKPIVCSLARAKKSDIERAAEALKNAKHPRIHTFIATSDIHLENKLNMTQDECLNHAVEMVKYAKTFIDDIQFSAEDATRTDKEFLVRIFSAVIEAGATVINIPDTVGFSQPHEYFELIEYIKENTKGIENVDISLHCHDDLGLAVSNALTGVFAGATQVECTINGLGERAGNSALEEVVMAIDSRSDYYNAKTNIVTEEIYPTSKLVSSISNVDISPTKSIIGTNCFLHESGIHQDGVIKNRATYEIMDPSRIGIPQHDNLVLGKHSGRHAFKKFLESNKINVPEENINDYFKKFKKLTDTKKYVTVEDIINIVNEIEVNNDNYHLKSYHANNVDNKNVVTVTLTRNGQDYVESAEGNGPVDASYKAINKIINKTITLLDFNVSAISDKSDAKGEAKVKMKYDNKSISTYGLSNDIIQASIEAYVQGINKLGL
ncbi:2-isopropylmalate synthase [Peptostreptococcus anaerobius]|uniref:2-isopropylmalate synthase n=1 Tax=Peptostreptococcus porci TaxID=2652282 RepID=A0A6N7WZQ2_9FIRM|nr:2-isopropylmalate synthase [Peptostreptococcus porci]MST61451.1 2-isopropylmalate synthase [Peptostreptococcus porci]